MGNCKDCKHWRRGTWNIYSDDYRERKSNELSPNAGQTIWEPADTSDAGFCDKIDEDSEMAFAVVGGYSDPFLENLYTMPDFGCVLFEQYTDKSIQELTINHNMKERGSNGFVPYTVTNPTHIPDPALDGLSYNPETSTWEPKT